MRQRKRLSGSALSLALGLLAPFAVPAGVAHAQSARSQPAREDRDQHVVFDDDLLDADLVTPFGDPVFSRHIRPGRVLLIRPRTSFVPELCRSVEHI